MVKFVEDDLHKPLVYSKDEEDLKPVKKQPSAAPSRRRSSSSGSCLSCCCKCMVITLVLFFALITITGMTIYGWISKVVQDFTVTEPLSELPIVEMTDEQFLAVKDRMTLFDEQLKAGNTDDLDDLIITQDEINGIIGRSDYLRGNAYITFEEGSVYEELSLPTDMLPGGAGRYFVAHDYIKMQGEDRIELKIETAALHHNWFDGPLVFAQLKYMVNENDLLELFLEKGSFFGQEADQEFIDQHINLLEGLKENEDDGSKAAREVFESIESVSYQPGMIVIHPRK